MVKTCRLRLPHIISNYRGKATLGLAVLLSIFSLALLAHSSMDTREAQATANTNINFQARLLTSGGALVPDGNYSIAFKVYPAVSGGSAPWTETQVVSVKNGYASVSLGSVTPFSGSGIDWTQEQWLTMNVNGDGEMSPRMKITAVPLALRSNQSDSLTNGASSLTAADLAQLAPGSVQSINSVNTALRLNQVGSGGLLQLQGNGSNVLTVSKAGDISTTAGITVGNSTLTTAGTIRWNGVDFEGYDGSQWKSLTVSAGGGGGGTVNQKTVIKTANETVTNNATLQDDDQLFFPIAANEKWAFRFVLQANAPATPDIKFAVTAPGGATCTVGVLDAEGAVAVGNLGCGVSSGLIVGNTTNDVYEVVGTVVNGATPGNVTLQWAQNTANGAGSVVYAGSYLLATSDTGTANQNFVQNGNSFGALAVLGTTDNYGLNLITNGFNRLTISNTGAVNINQGLTVANGLTVSAGGVNVTGNSVINGSLTGLTGLTVNSGGASVNGGLDLNNSNITNAGDITGVGNSIVASGGLTISTGAGNSLQLDSGNDILVLNDSTLRRTAVGTTNIELNDTADTILYLANSDGTAVANLSVEGSISGTSFAGDGSALTSLNASNITSGNILDSLLSSNVALLNAGQTFTDTQTFSDGLVVGNTALTTAGSIRWTGVDFEGYDGTSWVSLTSGSGGGGPAPLTVAAIQAYDNTGGTDLNTSTPTAVPWDSETKKDAGFTHSNVTNNTRVYLDEAGWYKINYNISSLNQSGNRNTVFCQVRFNGTTYNTPSGSYSYVRNNIDAGGTNSSSVYVQTTAANEYYEVLCSQSGSSGPQYAVAGSSWTIAEKTATPAGSPGGGFLQGGNSFGATAILGTTDTNSLSLVTDGVSRLVIDTNGDALFNSKATVTGDFIVNSNTFLNGDITLGDSSADVITLNSNTFQLLNGLNLDNGTLMIDSANNRIGINNSSPANTLSINSAATADSSAEVLIYTNSSTQKGLVIQNSAGQTANSFEVQSDNGVALLAFNPSGALIIGSDISGSSVAGKIILNDANNANGFASILGTSSVTANRNINLPDEDGTICLSGSASCGFINFAKATAQADSSTNSSIFINKTGASGDIITLQDNGNSVFRVARNGSLEIRQDSTVALAIKNSAGTDFFGVDTSGAIVRIGSSTADGVGTLLVLDSKNTAGDPTGSNGGMYYNSSSNKFRCYEDGKWIDCIGTRQVRSFIDTTNDAAVDANTTSYWDTGAENNNSVPNIAPSTTTKAVTGSVSMEVSSATTADRSIVARVERSIGSPASCGSGTPVGTILSTFTTNNGEQASNTMIFLDTPNTTNTVYYTLCSDSATSSAASMTINRIRITLEEANNSN